MSVLKIMEKDLQGRSFENDGFIYTFEEVTSSESDDLLTIIVNVTLPNKNQSYAVPKFSHDINKFMSDYAKYFDKLFSIELLILVEGQDVDGVYINPELLYEIKNTFDQTVKKISFTPSYGNPSKLPLSFEIDFLFAKFSFFRYEDEYLTFNFPMNIKNIHFGDKRMDTENFDKEKLSMLSGYLNDTIIDGSELREKLEDSLYEILEPQLKIGDSELYYNANTYVIQIDGKPVNTIWGDYKFSDFIS